MTKINLTGVPATPGISGISVRNLNGIETQKITEIKRYVTKKYIKQDDLTLMKTFGGGH